jgi:hypothetical protein
MCLKRSSRWAGSIARSLLHGRPVLPRLVTRERRPLSCAPRRGYGLPRATRSGLHAARLPAVPLRRSPRQPRGRSSQRHQLSRSPQSASTRRGTSSSRVTRRPGRRGDPARNRAGTASTGAATATTPAATATTAAAKETRTAATATRTAVEDTREAGNRDPPHRTDAARRSAAAAVTPARRRGLDVRQLRGPARAEERRSAAHCRPEHRGHRVRSQVE